MTNAFCLSRQACNFTKKSKILRERTGVGLTVPFLPNSPLDYPNPFSLPTLVSRSFSPEPPFVRFLMMPGGRCKA